MKLVAALILGTLVLASGPEDLTLYSRDARLAAILRIPEGHRPPYPAVVLVHGSGRVTARDILDGPADRLTPLGIAVLGYDKRGVGQSTGEYTTIRPGNSERMFDLLAADTLAAVAALKARTDIDPKRIGLLGFSQGGWIGPLAASRSSDVSFVITVSGPAVTVGEEIAYSLLAGADPGSEQGVSEQEIDQRMRAFTGPHGYNPAEALNLLTAPSLWLLGEKDRSIPLARTVENLTRLKTQGKPITTHVFAGVNHGLRDPATGAQPDFWRVMADWLAGIGIVGEKAPR